MPAMLDRHNRVFEQLERVVAGKTQFKAPRCGVWAREGGVVIKHNIWAAAEEWRSAQGIAVGKGFLCREGWGVEVLEAPSSAGSSLCPAHLLWPFVPLCAGESLKRTPAGERAGSGTAQPFRKWVCGNWGHRRVGGSPC